MADARGALDQARVGDGIGGARQEIGEPDCRSNGRGQDGEREVERAADLLEDRGGPGLLRHGLLPRSQSMFIGLSGGSGESFAFLRPSSNLRWSTWGFFCSAFI